MAQARPVAVAITVHYGYSPRRTSSGGLRRDLQGTYEKLRGEGVEVTEPVTEPWGSYVQVTDPDGHQFVISGA